jgi:glycerol-3-phosphate dehydrogenase
MTRETGVLVVGGGATGAGVARDLAMRGVEVTLAERGGLAGGTTGRSHGLLHSGARYAEADARGAEECIAENRLLREIAGACVRDTGGLFVSLAADDPAYFDRKVAACREVGIPATVLDVGTAREAVPDLAPTAERVCRVPDAVVYPSRLVAANAAAAEANGATVATDAPVEALHVEAGTVTGATLGGAVDERVDADYVVNATGAWAGRLAAMAGVAVEMRPTRGVMAAVDYAGLGPVLNRCREAADGDIVLPHDGQAVLGTTSVVVDDPDAYETPDWELERVVEECAAMLPPVATLDPERVWWGVRPLYAPDEDSRGTVDAGVGEARGISRGFFVLDHADDGADRFASVVGGKLTTYRRMAAAVADLVCEALDVDAPCRTDEERLPGADDPAELDRLVERYGGAAPTDADVVGADARASGD